MIKKLTIARKKILELMFLFKIASPRLIRKLCLILRSTLLFPFAKIVNSSKYGWLLQFKRWLTNCAFF